jgi:hypothetical protein
LRAFWSGATSFILASEMNSLCWGPGLGYDSWVGIFYPSGTAVSAWLEATPPLQHSRAGPTFYTVPGCHRLRLAHAPRGIPLAAKFPQTITQKSGWRTVGLRLSHSLMLTNLGKLGPCCSRCRPHLVPARRRPHGSFAIYRVGSATLRSATALADEGDASQAPGFAAAAGSLPGTAPGCPSRRDHRTVPHYSLARRQKSDDDYSGCASIAEAARRLGRLRSQNISAPASLSTARQQPTRDSPASVRSLQALAGL